MGNTHSPPEQRSALCQSKAYRQGKCTAGAHPHAGSNLVVLGEAAAAVPPRSPSQEYWPAQAQQSLLAGVPLRPQLPTLMRRPGWLIWTGRLQRPGAGRYTLGCRWRLPGCTTMQGCTATHRPALPLQQPLPQLRHRCRCQQCRSAPLPRLPAGQPPVAGPPCRLPQTELGCAVAAGRLPHRPLVASGWRRGVAPNSVRSAELPPLHCRPGPAAAAGC